ncbi:MAG: preprotein translocase subunit YajC [Bacteroidetes bacterium]|nr:preprotein translocase subunit YajC [Bacteroidota bacterium]
MLHLLLAAPQSGDGGGLLMTLLPLILIFAVFWFFIIRPQKKREQEREDMISALNKGDKVVTAGGIHGEVTQIDDDSLLLKVDNNTKLRVQKSAISSGPQVDEAKEKAE